MQVHLGWRSDGDHAAEVQRRFPGWDVKALPPVRGMPRVKATPPTDSTDPSLSAFVLVVRPPPQPSVANPLPSRRTRLVSVLVVVPAIVGAVALNVVLRANGLPAFGVGLAGLAGVGLMALTMLPMRRRFERDVLPRLNAPA